METPADIPKAKTGKAMRRHIWTLLKIAIAVVAIWWVLKAVSWYDTGELPAGASLRTLVFVKDTPVRALGQRLDHDRQFVRIQFPATPVEVRANLPSGETRTFAAVIDGDVVIPGTDEHVPMARELEVNLKELKNGRVHEGLRSLLIRASFKWHLLLAAWVLLGIPFLITAIRWRNLMRPQGIDMPLGKCLQLTFVGQFYSIILPGITGGDLVKIVYAARLTGSKTKSFITIVLDRVVGLVALMVIAGTSAGVQLYLNSRQPPPAGEGGAAAQSTLLNVFVLIAVLLTVLAAGSVVYFSDRMRRRLGITWFIENLGTISHPSAGRERTEHERLEHLFRACNGLVLAVGGLGAGGLLLLRWGTNLAWARHNTPVVMIGICVLGATALAAMGALVLHRRLVARATPLMGKVVQLIIGVDETLHVYRGHVGLLAWSFVISVISQLTLPISAWLCGMAFGMNAPVVYYLAYVPVAVLAASLPISPGGAGVLEIVMNQFFVSRGTATASQAFALTQSVRFLPILWNLCGSYWVVTGKYSREKELAAENQAVGSTEAT